MYTRVENKLRRLNATLYPRHMLMAPKWLVLGVNNTCNLHCKMCDVGVNYSQSNFFQNLMGTEPIHMPMTLFRRIADEAARHYPKVKMGYAFTEPLIYQHLDESLRYAQQKGLYTTITTNGLGLKKWAARLDDAGLAEVFISLDGPEKIHNMIRGNAHSYEKIVEGLEALVAMNSKVLVSVFCVITEWNTGNLIEMLDGLREYPIDTVGFMHSNFTTQALAASHNERFGGLYPATASNVTETNMNALNLETLWGELTEIKNRRYRFEIQFNPDLGSFEALERYYLHPEIPIGKKCMDIFSNLMIKSNGDVIPAHGRCYNLPVGNLYQQPLNAIWNSTVLSRFRKTVMREGGLLPACSRCCSAFVS